MTDHYSPEQIKKMGELKHWLIQTVRMKAFVERIDAGMVVNAMVAALTELAINNRHSTATKVSVLEELRDNIDEYYADEIRKELHA